MTNKKVIIIGGGVAGMSAAHELTERGYDVEIYERNEIYVGGKARSVDYKGSIAPFYKTPLPGEHGFRFFPGFYKHITDTMKRIPYTSAEGKAGMVYENLHPTSRIMIARYGKAPIITDASFPRNIDDIKVIIKDLFGTDTGLTHEEEKFFAERVWQLITSSTSRRNNDYERLGWWQYLEADRYSETYRSLLVQGLTRTLVAARAETASTKTGGNVFLQLLFCMIDPSINTDRVLDGPTNERWLNPWKDYLLSKGVKYYHAQEAVKFNINLRQIEFSGLIRSGQLTKAEAKERMKQPMVFDQSILEELYTRLNLTKEEWQGILNLPPKTYRDYPSYKPLFIKLRPFFWTLYKAGYVTRSFYDKFTKRD